jgi:hypothetical protein
MRNFFLSLVLVLGLSSCNDGDIIVTSFDFEDIALDVCGDVGDYVFFKINNVNLETLSFQLRTQDSILSVQDTLIYTIDAVTNVVNYRTFRDEISSSYFCSSIPPLTPEVRLNFTSSQGTARVATRIDTTITGQGSLQDTTIVSILNIQFTNLRLESADETITEESLELGTLETTLQ